MHTELCDGFGIEYPIFAFTPSEKVAAAVSKAGGLGMLGCVRFNEADDLEAVLSWMDDNTDGKPYGVDIVMPAKVPTEGSAVDINKAGRRGTRARRASGVWMGSAFLTAAEYHLGARSESGVSLIQQALLNATSSDTVRRRIYTGKPARLLKSRWTDAWDAPDAPEQLPMPLQNILVAEAHQRMNESNDPTTVAMPVGQIVGRMNEIRPVADIIAELVSGFEVATRRLDDIAGG